MATALLIQPSPRLFSASFLKNNGEPKVCCSASIQPSKPNSHLKRFRVRALKEKTEKIENPSSSSSPSNASAEEITKKYGLEAGLWKVPFSLFLPSLFSWVSQLGTSHGYDGNEMFL